MRTPNDDEIVPTVHDHVDDPFYAVQSFTNAYLEAKLYAASLLGRAVCSFDAPEFAGAKPSSRATSSSRTWPRRSRRWRLPTSQATTSAFIARGRHAVHGERYTLDPIATAK